MFITFSYRFLCEHMFLIRCLGVKLGIVDHSIGICLTIVSFCLTVKKLLNYSLKWLDLFFSE